MIGSPLLLSPVPHIEEADWYVDGSTAWMALALVWRAGNCAVAVWASASVAAADQAAGGAIGGNACGGWRVLASACVLGERMLGVGS